MSIRKSQADLTRDPEALIQAAIVRAGELARANPPADDRARWYAESLHVGDLAVLALALRAA